VKPNGNITTTMRTACQLSGTVSLSARPEQPQEDDRLNEPEHDREWVAQQRPQLAVHHDADVAGKVAKAG
jgi:hypothetical protein